LQRRYCGRWLRWWMGWCVPTNHRGEHVVQVEVKRKSKGLHPGGGETGVGPPARIFGGYIFPVPFPRAVPLPHVNSVG
jgi:hypothetical protein